MELGSGEEFQVFGGSWDWFWSWKSGDGLLGVWVRFWGWICWSLKVYGGLLKGEGKLEFFQRRRKGILLALMLSLVLSLRWQKVGKERRGCWF